MSGPVLIAVYVAAAVLSALLTWAVLGYARRAMLDQPGRRRSHTVATPRGGGISIVLTLLVAVACLTLAFALPLAPMAAFATGLLLVGTVGWIDDHRSLSPLLRLAVHVLAACLWVSQLPHSDGPLRFALQVFLLVTAINFWNFMDGINGLIVTQTVWVATLTMFAFLPAWPWTPLAATLAGASLGFLPFNFPRARIFLGDVGSGALGYASAALLLLAEDMHVISLWVALILPSALLLDAGFTLASRMLRGRRWYTAHREHLYQWLVRRGRSHAHTTCLYLLWNLILVLPLLWFAHTHPDRAALAAMAVAVAGAGAWLWGKRYVLAQVRAGVVR